MNEIKTKILEKIKKGEAKMRPRWHFILKGALIALGTVIIAFGLLYIVSFIVFAMRQTGAWFAPQFGFRGIGVFMSSIPWLLVLAAVVFIAVLEVLVRKYAFTYKRPLLYSVLGILVIVAVGSVFLSQIGVHRGLFMNAREGNLPVAGEFYKKFGGELMENITKGTVFEVGDGFILIEDETGKEERIIILENTILPFEGWFNVGERIMVFGEEKEDGIEAFGIRKIGEEIYLPKLRHMTPEENMPPFFPIRDRMVR